MFRFAVMLMPYSATLFARFTARDLAPTNSQLRRSSPFLCTEQCCTYGCYWHTFGWAALIAGAECCLLCGAVGCASCNLVCRSCRWRCHCCHREDWSELGCWPLPGSFVSHLASTNNMSHLGWSVRKSCSRVEVTSDSGRRGCTLPQNIGIPVPSDTLRRKAACVLSCDCVWAFH